MATKIPYLDVGWSITTGCGDDLVSEGCRSCYARRMFGRNLWTEPCPDCDGSGSLGQAHDGREVSCETCGGHEDALGRGKVPQTFAPTFHADRLDQPLHWRKPRVVGVSFMGDLFHEGITDQQIYRVFDVMRRAPQHTFLLLTKRPERQKHLMLGNLIDEFWPHVWPGVTVCNQAEADRNIPILQATPAAVRWVSYEPAIEAVNFRRGVYQMPPDGTARGTTLEGIDWMVCGGETGPGARPMQPEWALDVYQQCKAAGVPFWFKSMGTAPHKKVWDWTNTLGAEMQATHELPAVTL